MLFLQRKLNTQVVNAEQSNLYLLIQSRAFQKYFGSFVLVLPSPPCHRGYVQWRVFLRKKAQTNKASCADQTARSIAGGTVSPGMLLRVWEPVSQGGEMQFNKNKRQNFQRQKLWCFKKTLLSSELKFVLLHRRLLVCQDMGVRRNTRICL